MALEHERQVYVICADRKLRYENGYSHIAYIGTTRKGIARVAGSAAYRLKMFCGRMGYNHSMYGS
ncbi:hypothetical protein A9D14_18150 (plasmid) [Croceicoccus marinus]|uniref:Uncharacterized protein n=1 Tax=Croceicoccus marinus TaxID=450378 RepID=A0A217EYS3_9SPHN|nr:hypothetical protein A9D14_18150 [Croceicoccus marinus]